MTKGGISHSLGADTAQDCWRRPVAYNWALAEWTKQCEEHKSEIPNPKSETILETIRLYQELSGM